MITVLLTGFEPFDGQPVNASWAAVREVAALWAGPSDVADHLPAAEPGDAAGEAGPVADERGHDAPESGSREIAPAPRLIARMLPVSFARAPRRLAELIAEHRPDLVLCVGEAGGRARVSIERVGINVQDARIPDEDGAQPVDVPVVAHGPAAHFATLPIKAALLAARATSVPVEVSNTAGTYVCNTIAYTVGDLGVRGGFVHVPRLPEQMPAGAPAMAAADAARALVAILGAALSTADDAVVAAGAEH